MLIGYARVSTDDQNLDLQRRAMAAAGVERTFEDCVSGKTRERPGLRAALETCLIGDCLVVWRLDDNISEDGLVYGHIVSFEAGSDPAILRTVPGLVHGNWVQIGPLPSES
jgi:hypothetical protein